MSKRTTSKVPQIRFKGFSGEWEEQFLGELYTKIRNAFVGTATPYYTQKGHFYLQSNNVKNGEINRNTEVFINEEFYLRQKDNWLRSNDIVMVQSGHVGHTAVIPDELNNSAAHALIIISKPSRDTCSHYLNFYFQGNRAKRDLANITTGNTIKHILASEIKKFGAFFAHYEEQTQIGEYFREVDRLIGLHQRKHGKLVALKKAMLQKMFPQPGTNTPEIRFKGFSGDWAKEKLGSISESYSGGTPSVGNRSFYGGDIPFIRSAEINATSTELSITELGLQNSSAKMVSKGNVLYALYGATSGEVGISQINGAINQAILAITPHPGYSSEFLAIWLRNKKTFIVGTYIQGGQGNLSGNIVKSLEVDLPSSEEQQKIGTYFRTLDSLISKHAIQLQKLTQIKSACLKKMFV